MNIFSRIKTAIIYIFIDDLTLIVNRQELKELKRLINNMATKQEEFDAKITTLTERIDNLVTANEELATAVEAETAQIEEFMNNLPETVDTSALDGVITRLDSAVAEAEKANESVEGIFTPEVEEEPTPEVPPVEEPTENNG